MMHQNKIILAIVLILLSNCRQPTISPSLLDCYQSGSLKFRLHGDRIFVDGNISSDFSLNKRKVGWVISSNLLLKKENDEYVFAMADNGPYDWAIPNPAVQIVKVVSQDGVPFYFGRCLTGVQG